MTIAPRARNSPASASTERAAIRVAEPPNIAPVGFYGGGAAIGFPIDGPAARVIAQLPGADAIAIIATIYRALRVARVEAVLDEVAPAPATPLEAKRRFCNLVARATGPDGAWARQAIGAWERRAPYGETLERALGIAAPGRESWHAEERREARDTAICELCDMGYSADKIAEKVRRRHGVTREQPRVSTSREEELLKVICANDPPETERQIRNILNSGGNIRKLNTHF